MHETNPNGNPDNCIIQNLNAIKRILRMQTQFCALCDGLAWQEWRGGGWIGGGWVYTLSAVFVAVFFFVLALDEFRRYSLTFRCSIQASFPFASIHPHILVVYPFHTVKQTQRQWWPLPSVHRHKSSTSTSHRTSSVQRRPASVCISLADDRRKEMVCNQWNAPNRFAARADIRAHEEHGNTMRSTRPCFYGLCSYALAPADGIAVLFGQRWPCKSCVDVYGRPVQLINFLYFYSYLRSLRTHTNTHTANGSEHLTAIRLDFQAAASDSLERHFERLWLFIWI